jgi:hypothetical protein
MADIASLVRQLQDDGSIAAIAANPQAPFGTAARTYLGAQLLPERTVEDNAYREDAIRFRTVIANAGTRYSPTQKKGNELFASFLVELGESDIAREFTARDYDGLLRMLRTRPEMEAAATLVRWVDTLNGGLLELNELYRWQAIVNASVVRQGDNNYSETVSYANPAGHRAAAGGTWSNDSYDPFADIMAMMDLLASKGYTVNRIIVPRPVVSILAGNDKVKARTGIVTVSGGALTAAPGRASLEAINVALSRDGLPPMEQYDLQYRTQTGSGYFLPRNVFVMVATTGRDETLDLGNNEDLTLTNTLGYTAVGRAAGQATPGRVIRIEAKEDKPPRIEGEAWQTSLPVVTEPEAIAVITGIA